MIETRRSAPADKKTDTPVIQLAHIKMQDLEKFRLWLNTTVLFPAPGYETVRCGITIERYAKDQTGEMFREWVKTASYEKFNEVLESIMTQSILLMKLDGYSEKGIAQTISRMGRKALMRATKLKSDIDKHRRKPSG